MRNIRKATVIKYLDNIGTSYNGLCTAAQVGIGLPQRCIILECDETSILIQIIDDPFQPLLWVPPYSVARVY